jgi:hypothetical protein
LLSTCATSLNGSYIIYKMKNNTKIFSNNK